MSRAMKDSGVPWIGSIPQNWETAPIKSAVAWKSVKGHGQATVLSLYRDYGVVPKDSRDDNHNVTSTETDAYKFVEKGDLVINKMKAWQGSMAISQFEGIVSPAYHVAALTNENVYAPYFNYLIRDVSYLPEYTRLSTGMRIGQWDLAFDDFIRIPFLLPPLEEQQRIADFLDAQAQEVDAAIVKTRESIEEYKKLKQSVITQAVTKGIRPNRSMKDSGVEWIAAIPGNWTRVRFKDVFALQKGLSITKEDLRETGVSVISYGQVHSKMNTGTGLSPSLIRFVDEEYLITHPEALVRIGDFIFADTSEDMEGCGNCVYVNEEFPLFAGYHTVIARPKQPHYFRYFAYQFQSALWRSQLRCRVFGIKVYSVSQKILCTTTALLPPLQEQQEIVAYLDEKCGAIDALIEKKRQIITELESYKKSLIYEYVTGKKEVPA